MKNYLYFGINNHAYYTLQGNMSGDLTIDTSATQHNTNARGTGNDLGGDAYRTLITRSDVDVYVTPVADVTGYFGSDYTEKRDGVNAVGGVRYKLTQPESVTWANNSQDFVVKFKSVDTAHGITGKTGDIVEVVLKGGQPTTRQHGNPYGTSSGDNSGAGAPDRGDGLSGICFVYPEDSFLGCKQTADNTTQVIFKAADGSYSEDIITFTHTAGMGKQLIKEVTAFAKESNAYHGMMRVYDGIEPQHSLLSPEIGVVGMFWT
tara:strand:- start:367 stop:1152 length:786 start_codon:yes stop_codon:yes gene_type:complete